MMFKKGDKIRTEDGYMGEILFIDNNGIEAQAAPGACNCETANRNFAKVR